MKRRMMGTPFAIKTREAKDRFIHSNFKTTLAELHSDIINYGPDSALRKLLMSMISLEMAKNIGIDYHASTEELYYFMRKNDKETYDKFDGVYQSILSEKLITAKGDEIKNDSINLLPFGKTLTK